LPDAEALRAHQEGWGQILTKLETRFRTGR